MPRFTVLDRLCKHIACVKAEMWKDRKFFLLHDNAHRHTAAIVQQFLAKKRNGTGELPSIFARFKPLDYFSFPKLKLKLKGDYYASIKDIQKSVTAILKAFPISGFARAKKRFEDRANECIQVSGDYFE